MKEGGINMLRKDELLGEIKRLLIAKVAQKNWQKDVATSINEKRNVPIETAISILTQRTDLKDYKEFIIFCIAEGCGTKRD